LLADDDVGATKRAIGVTDREVLTGTAACTHASLAFTINRRAMVATSIKFVTVEFLSVNALWRLCAMTQMADGLGA
jgi:hypothetical protein